MVRGMEGTWEGWVGKGRGRGEVDVHIVTSDK